MTIKRTKIGHPAARAKRRLRPVARKVARARSSDAGDITSKPMLIGYARVSTVDQNLALQRDALTEAGCTKIFTEQMSGAVADRPALHDALEFARSLIRECTQAGLAAARRAGRTGGRPPKLTDHDIEAAKAMLANPDIGVTQIAHRLGVSPATLYRYLPAARTANTPGV
jgi:DNA invertase Pin-like site-specific DNA recombinase